MKPYYEESGITIYNGDCRDVLPTLEPVDAVVTDPPYGLRFMGKRWDYDVPSIDLWKTCLRVLKPGTHLLAFAGTRTQHRMAVNIEDAGFEIRDLIAWVYGSGFPKSHDVSKAIDKRRDDHSDIAAVVRFLESSRKAAGVSRREVEEHFGTVNIGQGFFTLTPGSKPRVPMWEQWGRLKALLNFSDDMDAEVWRLNGRKGKPGPAWAEREVVEQRRDNGGRTVQYLAANKNRGHTFDITAPATEAARRWEGFGTALKPALEPITLARKPLEGTIAQNVLVHGTGALNVDGCRVGTDVVGWGGGGRAGGGTWTKDNCGLVKDGDPRPVSGRWPANLIHDSSPEVLALFPDSKAQSGGVAGWQKGGYVGGKYEPIARTGYDDNGSAARFFKSFPRFHYSPKASGSDRGNKDLPALPLFGVEAEEIRNQHPTVKPIDLMRYLCRLITPPGGIVLDPFMGSGSTLLAAKREGFQAIGIEINEKDCEFAANRLREKVLNLQDAGQEWADCDEAVEQTIMFEAGE